ARRGLRQSSARPGSYPVVYLLYSWLKYRSHNGAAGFNIGTVGGVNRFVIVVYTTTANIPAQCQGHLAVGIDGNGQFRIGNNIDGIAARNIAVIYIVTHTAGNFPYIPLRQVGIVTTGIGIYPVTAIVIRRANPRWCCIA